MEFNFDDKGNKIGGTAHSKVIINYTPQLNCRNEWQKNNGLRDILKIGIICYQIPGVTRFSKESITRRFEILSQKMHFTQKKVCIRINWHPLLTNHNLQNLSH